MCVSGIAFGSDIAVDANVNAGSGINADTSTDANTDADADTNAAVIISTNITIAIIILIMMTNTTIITSETPIRTITFATIAIKSDFHREVLQQTGCLTTRWSSPGMRRLKQEVINFRSTRRERERSVPGRSLACPGGQSRVPAAPWTARAG
jgi:hypothetical protein